MGFSQFEYLGVLFTSIMTTQTLDKLKYPIGKFIGPETFDEESIHDWIADIRRFPELIEDLVRNLSVEELNLQYRPNGWSIKQVVHHCADSHLNAFIRFKLALTEDAPVIKPYHQDRWSTLVDGMDDNIMDSLLLLKSLHAKWAILLQHLTPEDLKRVYIHPEHNKEFSLKYVIGMYAWHGNHHLAHIKQGLKYKGNF